MTGVLSFKKAFNTNLQSSVDEIFDVTSKPATDQTSRVRAQHYCHVTRVFPEVRLSPLDDLVLDGIARLFKKMMRVYSFKPSYLSLTHKVL